MTPEERYAECIVDLAQNPEVLDKLTWFLNDIREKKRAAERIWQEEEAKRKEKATV